MVLSQIMGPYALANRRKWRTHAFHAPALFPAIVLVVRQGPSNMRNDIDRSDSGIIAEVPTFWHGFVGVDIECFRIFRRGCLQKLKVVTRVDAGVEPKSD